MGPGDVQALGQRRQALEQAKAQLASITGRTQTTTECIKILVEAGKVSESRQANIDTDYLTDPLLVALCKVQLAQLRMAEAEGLAAIENLTTYIKVNESPLFGATLIPPGNRNPRN